MTKKTKSVVVGFALSVLAPLMVSILIAGAAWYTNSVAQAEQDKARDERIQGVKADLVLYRTETNAKLDAQDTKVNKILEDVGYIRGLMDGSRR